MITTENPHSHFNQDRLVALHFFAASMPRLVDHCHLSNRHGTKRDDMSLIEPSIGSIPLGKV